MINKVVILFMLVFIMLFMIPRQKTNTTRNLNFTELLKLHSAIGIIKNNPNYRKLGSDIENLVIKNKYIIESKFSGTYIGGEVIPMEIFNRKIRLSPDCFDFDNHNIFDLIEVVIHEYIHYTQNIALPFIIQPIVGWSSILDLLYQKIIDDKYAVFPFSFEDGAYKVSEKIKKDLQLNLKK